MPSGACSLSLMQCFHLPLYLACSQGWAGVGADVVSGGGGGGGGGRWRGVVQENAGGRVEPFGTV